MRAELVLQFVTDLCLNSSPVGSGFPVLANDQTGDSYRFIQKIPHLSVSPTNAAAAQGTSPTCSAMPGFCIPLGSLVSLRASVLMQMSSEQISTDLFNQKLAEPNTVIAEMTVPWLLVVAESIVRPRSEPIVAIKPNTVAPMQPRSRA